MTETPPAARDAGPSAQHAFVFIDFGLFVSHALALAEEGYRVLYWTPAMDRFPAFARYAVGLGWVERPFGLFEALSACDPAETTVVCPDVGAGDIAVALRAMGWSVLGAGVGDRLEHDRMALRTLCASAGLPVAPWQRVEGVSALERALADRDDRPWVKLDIWRGDQESFRAGDPMQPLFLARLRRAWGPFAEHRPFLVEAHVEGEELGYDALVIDGACCTPTLWGSEIMKGAYAGTVAHPLPEPLARVAEALTPILRRCAYRGWFSTEVRLGPAGPVVIDVCARAPSPLGAVYPRLYANFAELIWRAARGLPATPRPRGRYCCVVPVEARTAEHEWIWLDVPEEIRPWVMPRLGARDPGRRWWVVPGLRTACIVVAVEDELERAREVARERVGALGGWELVADLDGLDRACRQLASYVGR